MWQPGQHVHCQLPETFRSFEDIDKQYGNMKIAKNKYKELVNSSMVVLNIPNGDDDS